MDGWITKQEKASTKRYAISDPSGRKLYLANQKHMILKNTLDTVLKQSFSHLSNEKPTEEFYCFVQANAIVAKVGYATYIKKPEELNKRFVKVSQILMNLVFSQKSLESKCSKW